MILVSMDLKLGDYCSDAYSGSQHWKEREKKKKRRLDYYEYFVVQVAAVAPFGGFLITSTVLLLPYVLDPHHLNQKFYHFHLVFFQRLLIDEYMPVRLPIQLYVHSLFLVQPLLIPSHAYELLSELFQEISLNLHFHLSNSLLVAATLLTTLGQALESTVPLGVFGVLTRLQVPPVFFLTFLLQLQTLSTQFLLLFFFLLPPQLPLLSEQLVQLRSFFGARLMLRQTCYAFAQLLVQLQVVSFRLRVHSGFDLPLLLLSACELQPQQTLFVFELFLHPLATSSSPPHFSYDWLLFLLFSFWLQQQLL
mmetsp:Transcript_18461/g.21871  ORF Transcript_18461/g.21871 Transcript_18461/m.21871 type:complete len:307 (-) Transcript_18461:379-1299(-)